MAVYGYDQFMVGMVNKWLVMVSGWLNEFYICKLSNSCKNYPQFYQLPLVRVIVFGIQQRAVFDVATFG